MATAQNSTSDKKPSALRDHFRKPRKVRKSSYRSFKLQKKLPQSAKPLATGPQLLKQAVALLAKHWRIFGLLALVYAVISLVVVQNISSSDDISTLQTSLQELFKGQWSQVFTSSALVILLGSGSSTQMSAYHFVWVILGSLALIWTLREVYAGRKVRVRDAFYVGVYPFTVFTLVLVVIGLDCLPAIVGANGYNTLISNGIAASGIEQVLWAVVGILLGLLSVYLVGMHLMALYIACLPQMTPIKALRSSHELTKGRIGLIVRRVFFLLLVMLILAAILLVPLVLYVPVGAITMFFICGVLSLVLFHAYLYCLYRALL